MHKNMKRNVYLQIVNYFYIVVKCIQFLYFSLKCNSSHNLFIYLQKTLDIIKVIYIKRIKLRTNSYYF